MNDGHVYWGCLELIQYDSTVLQEAAYGDPHIIVSLCGNKLIFPSKVVRIVPVIEELLLSPFGKVLKALHEIAFDVPKTFLGDMGVRLHQSLVVHDGDIHAVLDSVE